MFFCHKNQPSAMMQPMKSSRKIFKEQWYPCLTSSVVDF